MGVILVAIQSRLFHLCRWVAGVIAGGGNFNLSMGAYMETHANSPADVQNATGVLAGT